MPVDDRLRAGLAAQADLVQPDVDAHLMTTLVRYRRRQLSRSASVVGLTAVACLAAAVVLATHGEPAPAPPVPARTPSTSSTSTSTYACSILNGGCLGDLAPGTYRTEHLQPALAYTVPEGWRHTQDLPASFQLVRQEDDQSVGGGTYIAVYRDVSAAATTCAEKAQRGVGRTPQALVSWFRQQPALQVSAPTAVTIGGLKGYQVDVDVADGQETCSLDRGRSRGTPLITRSDGLYHVAASNIHVRLLILEWQSGNLTIEITGAKALHPGTSFAHMAQPVVESFRFAR